MPLWGRTAGDEARCATHISIYAPGNAGIFYRIGGGISLCGANSLDARVHTPRDGMALDNLIVQGALGQPLDESAALERLRKTVISAISGEIRLGEKLAERRMARHRADVFTVEPDVLIDNRASNRYTVVEVHALDRPALLYGLTRTFFDAKLTIRSAHVD